MELPEQIFTAALGTKQKKMKEKTNKQKEGGREGSWEKDSNRKVGG
jgi:hypothetical protein